MHYNKNRYIVTLVLALLSSLALASPRVHAGATTNYRVFVPVVSIMKSAWSQEESAVMQLINQQRQAAGCPAVQPNHELGIAAERHSQDMAAQGTLSHTGSDGSSFFQRAGDADYSFFASGEIIAAGYATAEAVVDGWMNSPGHQAIILTCDNTDIGVGEVTDPNSQWRFYWTAVFGQQ